MTARPLDLNLRRFIRPLGEGAHLTVWVALAAMILFGALRYDNFLSSYNLLTAYLGNNMMFVLISVGMCLVIMTGGIDLSVGTVAALSSVVATLLHTNGLAVALSGGVLVGLLVGGVNAGLIVGLRIPPFMATLATMLAARGLALVASGNGTVSVTDYASSFAALGMSKIGGYVPWTIPIAALVVLVAWYILERTPLGRTVLSVGGNAEAAHLMGLKTGRALVFVYLFSGACAGLAGVFLASPSGGQPLEGVGWELAAISAVVVGGTLLTGGMGSVPATVAGALLFGLVFNLLNFESGRPGGLELSPHWQSVIRGAFLLVVILLQVRLARPAART